MKLYFGSPFLDIPDGFVITDGVLHPEGHMWDDEVGGWVPQF